jgi:hypothetical protein
MLSILPKPQHVRSERSLAGLRRRISRDVGAGISGVDDAYHLTKQCPHTSFVVVEAQELPGTARDLGPITPRLEVLQRIPDADFSCPPSKVRPCSSS